MTTPGTPVAQHCGMRVASSSASFPPTKVSSRALSGITVLCGKCHGTETNSHGSERYGYEIHITAMRQYRCCIKTPSETVREGGNLIRVRSGTHHLCRTCVLMQSSPSTSKRGDNPKLNEWHYHGTQLTSSLSVLPHPPRLLRTTDAVTIIS